MRNLADPNYFLLTLRIHRVEDVYHLSLGHVDPTSAAQTAEQHGQAGFDLAELRALQALPVDYGQALTQQLFADACIRQRFVDVERAAQAASCFLRFSLAIDPAAAELQSLRWELLRHPAHPEVALCTSERVLFSRFMVSRDWRPVKLRAKTELRALIAVAAPPGESLARMQLAPVDWQGEVARVKQALAAGGITAIDTLGGPGAPVTVDRLVDRLRGGVDILYWVCHGQFRPSDRTPFVILQDDSGAPRRVEGAEVALRIGELQQAPRLGVLASCQSAGEGEPVQATLAGRLAEAGVPAVVAMQGYISMATVERMMPVFFRELLRDGQIDRALAVARGAVRERDDAWMPLVYSRLTSGCIWYLPGFSGGESEAVWQRLVKPVRDGKVVPILGPGLLQSICDTPFETARRLAEQHQFPLGPEAWDDLPRVTQYLAVKESRYNAVRAYQDALRDRLVAQHAAWLPESERQATARLGRLLELVGQRLRSESPRDPYRILAELPARVYVTTTFDPLLEAALKEAEREPQTVVSRWRYQRPPETRETQAIGEPIPQRPLVYHAFGVFGKDTDDTLVITEDDYFDFLIGTASDKLVPPAVESALVDNSLVFLGFRLTDWSFRVLFRLMMSLPGKDRLKNYCHVAVQLVPELHTAHDADGLRAYLAEYFGKQANIDIFWGSAAEFLQALDTALQAAGAPAGEAPGEEASDAWDF